MTITPPALLPNHQQRAFPMLFCAQIYSEITPALINRNGLRTQSWYYTTIPLCSHPRTYPEKLSRDVPECFFSENTSKPTPAAALKLLVLHMQRWYEVSVAGSSWHATELPFHTLTLHRNRFSKIFLGSLEPLHWTISRQLCSPNVSKTWSSSTSIVPYVSFIKLKCPSSGIFLFLPFAILYTTVSPHISWTPLSHPPWNQILPIFNQKLLFWHHISIHEENFTTLENLPRVFWLISSHVSTVTCPNRTKKSTRWPLKNWAGEQIV